MNFLSRFKLHSDQKVLNFASFVFLIISDIFIMYILFYGLSQQIKQLSDEYDYFPYMYRNMLIEKEWVENNVVSKIADEILQRKRMLYDVSSEKKKLHPVCQEIDAQFKQIIIDKEIIDNIELYDRLQVNYNNLSKKDQEATLGADLINEIGAVKHTLEKNPKISNLIELIFKSQNSDYTNDIKNHRRIFALKRVGLDFAFLLPIIVLFILWNRKAYKKQSNIGLVISSHYVAISFIPILFEIFRLIIEIIPKILFKAIYDYLLKLNLLTLWYYVIVFISVMLLLGIIWILQTKVFTTEKLNINRYKNRRCMHCNNKINYDSKNCPICGVDIYTTCFNCNAKTIKGLQFCKNCGKEL